MKSVQMTQGARQIFTIKAVAPLVAVITKITKTERPVREIEI
jgi:hypothetical protein